VNATTIGVISGGADGTYIRIAADLANVLDSDQLRILPIIGRGSLQNLRDLMFLRGVDVGIVQMDAREGLRVDSLYENATQKLRYIARLYNEEVHVLARKGIVDVRELNGKRVNIDKAGSGTNLTARVIFDRLGIKPEFTAFDQSSSYERLRTGEIDAALYVAGRPVRAIAEFSGQADFHLLAIPFESELAQTYFPARFTSEDYPRLVEAGRTVETIAVGNLLVVFNWPSGSERYHRLTRFVDGFFSQFDGLLQPGRHPKWREVNLSATVPNWQRFRPAEEWLQRQERQSAETASDFGRFLETTSHGASPSALDRERLFEQFLSWQRARTSNVKGTNNRLDGRRQ
jgi:TRAP transporter TAXI family solute receptor